VIVLDCSVVVDVLVAAPGADVIAERLASETLAAPSLLDVEFVSALRRMVRHGELTSPRALDALSDYDALAVDRYPTGDGLRRRAFSLRDSLTAYDATYVALAESLDAPLLTRDAPLHRTTGHGARIEFV
jgi:predicted nucleic acid-binding protein